MIKTIYLTTVICDGCGCATLHDDHVRGGSFHYNELRNLFENEGWGEVDGKHYCPACLEDMPTEMVHPNLRDDNDEIAHIELPILVNRESAKALKKAGFPQRNVEFHCIDNDGDELEFPAAPSLGLALKWLRDKKGLFIEITFNRERKDSFYCDVEDMVNDCYIGYNYQQAHPTYEDAINAGITAACMWIISQPSSENDKQQARED